MKRIILIAVGVVAAAAACQRPVAERPTGAGTSDTVAQPDNTKNNMRDRKMDTITPGDQSNAKADIDVTANIRRTLVSDSTLSMSAKNVKVVTENGVVTLRGVVKSTDERDRVEAAARANGQGYRIDDQLEVAP